MAGMKTKGILYPLVGLDLGSQSIKAVAISGKKDKYNVVSCAEVPTPAGTIEDGVIKDQGKLELALRDLIKELSNKPKFVATSVSGTRVTTKIIDTDAKMSDSQLSEFVEEQAESILAGDKHFDYEVLRQEGEKNKVLMSVVSSDLVEDRVSVISQLSMQVKVMDVSVHALTRAVRSVVSDTVLKSGKRVAILDIGATTLSFAVLDEELEVVYQRVMPGGGNTLTENISAATGMDTETAEVMKVEDRIPEQSRGVEDQYINSVIRNLERFAGTCGYRDIDTIVVTGGGAKLKRLQNQLRSTSQQKRVIIPDMSKIMKPGSRPDDGLKYMTALGLALRSFVPCPI